MTLPLLLAIAACVFFIIGCVRLAADPLLRYAARMGRPVLMLACPHCGSTSAHVLGPDSGLVITMYHVRHSQCQPKG